MAFLATRKTQEVPASRLQTPSRTQQILHSEVVVEESAGSLELSLPALSSYQYVHGNFNRETLEVSERGLRGSARGAKLEKQKNERVDKKLEVSVSSAPEPRRPHHEGAF